MDLEELGKCFGEALCLSLAKFLTNMHLNGCAVCWPHGLEQGATRVGQRHQLPAAIHFAVFTLNVTCLLQPVDQARHVVLGDEEPRLDLNRAQARTVRAAQFKQHVIPSERRKARRLQVGFNRAKDLLLRAHKTRPGKDHGF